MCSQKKEKERYLQLPLTCKEEESMISGILLILFLCAMEWLGAHIVLEANPQAKREYYNNNDPFKTLFM